jgi:hypothetical protein
MYTLAPVGCQGVHALFEPQASVILSKAKDLWSFIVYNTDGRYQYQQKHLEVR